MLTMIKLFQYYTSSISNEHYFEKIITNNPEVDNPLRFEISVLHQSEDILSSTQNIINNSKREYVCYTSK